MVDFILISVRILMAIIGIGAVILSIYYTYVWLAEFLNMFLALLLSTIMIAFSVMAFEVMVIFWQNKQRGVIPLFCLLWLVVLIFSMISTIAGQYNSRMSIEIEEKNKKVGVEHKRLEISIYSLVA